jgi:hypothetical protein
MELSPYVEGLRRDLGTLTRFAPDEVAKLAAQLAEALDSSVRLTLLNVLTEAAAEITGKLDATIIDVTLSGGEPEFVVATMQSHPQEPVSPPAPGPEATADEGTARITLRLSEGIKARVEAQASAAGLSVNSWLAHAVIRALEIPADSSAATSQRSRPGHRISGYARS